MNPPVFPGMGKRGMLALAQLGKAFCGKNWGFDVPNMENTSTE